MTAEDERTRLIGEIARVLREGPVPDEARSAALTLIGWLARRMPGEPVSVCDLKRCTGLDRGRAHSPGLGRGGGHLHVPRLDGLDGRHPHSRTEWSHTDDPPVSTVNGPHPGSGSVEAPSSRRTRSAR
jgi:hypothetical protein